MKIAKQYGLLPADRIVAPIFATGLTKHHAIYLGMDHHGTEWVAENHKFDGVRLVKAADYFSREKVQRIERFCGSYLQREAAVKRALSKLGQPYDLVRYNCEHYASFVQTGKVKSDQVDGIMESLKTIGIAIMAISLFNLLTND